MKKIPDRELIALAAKAADIKPPASPYEGTIDTSGAFVYYDDCEGKTWHSWNPLANDGDAFRLSVSLGMRVHQMPGFGCDSVICAADGGWAQESYGTDRLVATRRAITRAAAEIGRALS